MLPLNYDSFSSLAGFLAGSVCWLETSDVTCDTPQWAPGIGYLAWAQTGLRSDKKARGGIPRWASDAPGLSPIKSRVLRKFDKLLQRSQRSLKQFAMEIA